MTLTALVVVVLAVTAALVYNRVVWRPRQAAGRVSQDGVSIAGIIGPPGTLSVLLLVFVLVQTYASWSAAGDAETAEATATLLLFREADLVKDARTRNRLRAAVVCYATSVIRQEWPAMQHRRVSSVPTYWGARIREAGVRLTRTSAEKNAGENVVARDGQRASARQVRLGEARPTVPGALFVLMVLAVAVTLGIVGAVTERSVGRGVHLVIVVAIGVVLAATLTLVRDLDQPLRGRAPAQSEPDRVHPRADRAGGPWPAAVRRPRDPDPRAGLQGVDERAPVRLRPPRRRRPLLAAQCRIGHEWQRPMRLIRTAELDDHQHCSPRGPRSRNEAEAGARPRCKRGRVGRRPRVACSSWRCRSRPARRRHER